MLQTSQSVRSFLQNYNTTSEITILLLQVGNPPRKLHSKKIKNMQSLWEKCIKINEICAKFTYTKILKNCAKLCSSKAHY